MSMGTYSIASCTDTGKVRRVNEDSMAAFESPNGSVVVVCDGMGGQNAGDVASQLAVKVIKELLTDNQFSNPGEAIIKSVCAANQAILMRAAQNPNLAGMGATCVILIVADGKVYYGSVGDSRIYCSVRGMIRQLTKDQSYVQTLVDAGELNPEDAEHHKDKNQITNALGLENMTPPVLGSITETPEAGTVFLLCSDGLSGMVSNSDINRVMADNGKSLQDRARELVSLANAAGGLDNITVQLVEFGGDAPGAAAYQPGATAAQDGSYRLPNAGNPAAKAKKKNGAVVYWVVTVVCLVLAIGGVTYWLISRDSKPSQPTTTTAPAPTPAPTPKVAQPTAPAPPAPAQEVQKVVVVETKKSGKGKKGATQKEPKTNSVEDAKGQLPTGNPTETDTVRMNKVVGNLSDEKGGK